MIDPTQAATAARAARLHGEAMPAARTKTKASPGADFATQLARLTGASTAATTPSSPPASTSSTSATGATASTDAAKTSGTVRAVPRPDNEQTTKVAGHAFSKIMNGKDKGLYLNQLDGSPREGAVFRLVERDDRVFHVYGSGKDKVVVEVKKAAAASSSGATGGTTAAAT